MGALSEIVNVATPGDTSAALAAHAGDLTIHSSGQEIDYLEDISTTKYTLTTSSVYQGLSIVVPASTQPAWLTTEALLDVTTAPAAGGTGTATLQIKNSGGTVKGAGIMSFESGSGTQGLVTVRAFLRVAPGAGDTYSLWALRGGDSTFRADIVNANTLGESARTFLAGHWR